jgi:hypothetical protein
MFGKEELQSHTNERLSGSIWQLASKIPLLSALFTKTRKVGLLLDRSMVYPTKLAHAALVGKGGEIASS